VAQNRTIGPDDIPPTWGDITPEWATEAIRSRHPDAEVSEVEVLLSSDGTNRRARIGLSYRAGSGPDRLFLKAEVEAHRELHARHGFQFNEAELFASEVPLPVEHPLAYRIIIDRPRLDYIIVMEDLTLRGADPRDATRPLDIEEVRNGLLGLSLLHSRYWEFSGDTHPTLAWVGTWKPAQEFQVWQRERLPLGMERATDILPAEIADMSGDDIVDQWARFVSTLEHAVTLLHGDPHIGNTYVLPGGQVGFLDWQNVVRGNWSSDVGYFLVGALTVEQRRASAEYLLDDYIAALELTTGIPPSQAEARLRYRASAAYGLSVWLGTLGSDDYQPAEVCRALVARYAAAFVEVGSVHALSELGV
jgi:hypothetical protein